MTGFTRGDGPTQTDGPGDEFSDKEKLHSKLMDDVRSARKSRASREPEWYVNREFYRGNQHAVWVDGKLYTDPVKERKADRKPRLIINQARTQIETLVSYLLKQEPVFTVAAQSSEQEDLAAALVGETVLYHYWDALNCGRKLHESILWAFCCSKGWVHVGWDPMGGRKIPVTKTVTLPPLIPLPGVDPAMMDPQALLPQTQEVPDGAIPEGEVTSTIVSPFELFVDPGASTLEDAQWVAWETMRPIAEMRALYPEFADDIKDEKSTMEQGWARNVLSRAGAGSNYLERDKLRRVKVIEYYHRANDKYPNGMRVVALEQKILDVGPTPPGYDEIPFAEMEDNIVPGEFYGEPTMKDIVPLQKEYNRRASQLIDIANKFKTKYFAAQGSISEEDLNDEDGEVIFHFPGQRPEASPPPPVPDSLIRILELTKENMKEVSGAVSVLQGQASGEVRSGRQVAYQGQYGETRIGLKAKNVARFLSRWGHLILKMVSKNVLEQRVARVVGKSRRQEIKFFHGADLNGNCDVVVQAGSMLGYTKQERFSALKDMHQAQIISGEQFLQHMEMEDFSGITEDIALDRNNACEENEMWRQGKPAPEPRHFEDHSVHLRNHNQFRKGAAYRMMDPQMQMQIDMHCQVHENFLNPPMMPPGPMDSPPEPTGGPAKPGASNGPSGAEEHQGVPPVPEVPDHGAGNQGGNLPQ